MLITKADKFYPLPVDEVCFFYTLNEKVMAYTADGKVHPVDRTLDALGEQLDGDTFFRANRQFIIARKAIRDIDLWFGSRLSVNLQIPLPERIIISKTKTPVFKRWIAAEQ
ncbi:DNA-binding LytR/AlgR family response regulator [Macellibacteroides fermentans]|uniref:DNA-binding LytR/AlgR family response regulator n=1 Tax=Macellibacteroides fermentans TaxID=879969 RepID=A0A8E2A8C5_9PORP|nr:LytTR family transcriptional regulator [Parabacteroides chartae]NYI50756.1 DNA-binding LytR/AlgR family response regulator [Macellibacteroides fermentans]